MKIVENTVSDYLTANFTEDETLWLVGSTFNYADEIRYGHYIYKYAGTDGTNTTDNPYVDSLKVTPTWVNIRPSNYYGMLDGKTSTQTENADTITVTLTCNNLDTISLLELDAVSVSLSLYDNDTAAVVYTEDFDLINNTEVIDFYTYAFEPFEYRPSIYTDALYLYTDATLTVVIDKTGSTAKCGRLVLGRSYYVGDVGYGASLTVESYSHKETDEFGNSTLIHRDSVNIDSYEIRVPTQKIPVLRRKGKSLDAIPILFVMDESSTSTVEHLLNFGYWDRFNMIVTNPVESTISLDIKGIL
jgi:hypothetical protein